MSKAKAKTKAPTLAKRVGALERATEQLLAQEQTPPLWLKDLVVAIAASLGITPEELAARVKVVHPTPADPVLLVDGVAIVSWV